MSSSVAFWGSVMRTCEMSPLCGAYENACDDAFYACDCGNRQNLMKRSAACGLCDGFCGGHPCSFSSCASLMTHLREISCACDLCGKMKTFYGVYVYFLLLNQLFLHVCGKTFPEGSLNVHDVVPYLID